MRSKMSQDGLKVIIVGGGIAGLAAAISIRRNGHQVEVFEQSRFLNEVGAAIHMTPNATGILRQIGIDPRDSGAVLLNQVLIVPRHAKKFEQLLKQDRQGCSLRATNFSRLWSPSLIDGRM